MFLAAAGLTAPGDKDTWIALASIAFTAAVFVAVLLAASRRLERRAGHRPRHGR